MEHCMIVEQVEDYRIVVVVQNFVVVVYRVGRVES
jgi:hypothetical protein